MEDKVVVKGVKKVSAKKKPMSKARVSTRKRKVGRPMQKKVEKKNKLLCSIEKRLRSVLEYIRSIGCK